MKREQTASFFFSLIFLVIAGCAPGIGVIPADIADESAAPVPFEPNFGQSPTPARFLSRADQFTTYVAHNEARVVLINSENTRDKLLSIHPVDGQLTFPEPVNQYKGKSSYSIGDRNSRTVEPPLFGGVRYEKVFPGVDVTYSVQADRLAYELVLHPGAKIEDIKFEIDGLDELSLDSNGNIIGRVQDTRVLQRALTGVQNVGGRTVEVPIKYALIGGRYLTLEAGDYDHSSQLRLVPQMIAR